MVAVPVHGEHCERVALVRLQILPCIALGALVDVALLGAHQEHVLDVRIEVETQAAGVPAEHALVLLFGLDVVQLGVYACDSIQFVLVVHLILLLRLGYLQGHDFLALQLITHQGPAADLSVRRDGLEVLDLGVLFAPLYLPHGVRVLVCPHSRLEDGLGYLVADVVHHDCAVVASDAQERGVLHIEIYAHHT